MKQDADSVLASVADALGVPATPSTNGAIAPFVVWRCPPTNDGPAYAADVASFAALAEMTPQTTS
jgi:hypothetical protein